MIKRISLVLLCLSIALPALPVVAANTYDLYVQSNDGTRFDYEGTYGYSDAAVVADEYRKYGRLTQCYQGEDLVMCPSNN